MASWTPASAAYSGGLAQHVGGAELLLGRAVAGEDAERRVVRAGHHLGAEAWPHSMDH